MCWLFCKPCIHIHADLIKKLLRAAQDVLELGQLQEVLFQRLLVGVYFLQLVLQLLERGLKLGRACTEGVSADIKKTIRS